MFLVRHKETGKIRTVYGWNGTYFLVFGNEGWSYIPMDEYEPWRNKNA